MLYKFKRWVRNWLNSIDEPEENGPYVRRNRPVAKVGLAIGTTHDEANFGIDPIKLYIYPANGGFVIETKTYDEKRDRHNSCLYINVDQETLGDEIGKIITMASLSR